MRLRQILIFAVLGGFVLACNLPFFAAAPTETPTASSVPATDTALPALPTFTPPPTATPTATVVPTPSVPEVTPISVNVNCRSGPDVGYDAVSALLLGNTTQVVGRLDDSSWWYVKDPGHPGKFCWIAAGVVTIAGPIAGIPVQTPPPPIVTKVTVDVTLPSTVHCGEPNPVDFSGTITTNGPATVQYQWEITGDKTNTTSPESLTFTDAGQQDAADPGAYNVDCGHYKITLHVLNPNDKSASKDFSLSAP